MPETKPHCPNLNFEEWLAKTIPELLAFLVEKNTITANEYLETKGQDYSTLQPHFL